MKALRLRGALDLRLEVVPEPPDCGENEVKVWLADDILGLQFSLRTCLVKRLLPIADNFPTRQSPDLSVHADQVHPAGDTASRCNRLLT